MRFPRLMTVILLRCIAFLRRLLSEPEALTWVPRMPNCPAWHPPRSNRCPIFSNPCSNCLSKLVPARFRTDIPVVPVVRLSGVIGVVDAVAAGTDAVLDRPFAGARLRDPQCPRRGADRQFAGRLAGAVASDLPPHPPIGRGKEIAGHRLCRGCRRLGWLHAGLRRRRDHLRPIFDRRLDRRGRRLVRLSQADGKARRGAQALHRRRTQGDARSVPAGKTGGRKTHQGDPERHPRALHCSGQRTPRRPS